MEILLCLSIALFAGLLLSRLAKVLKLPAVTAYLVAGILVGPYCLGALGNLIGVPGLGFTSEELLHSMGIISDVALGFIAFLIGNEFRLSQLKKVGKQAAVIGIFQAVVATVVVDVVLIAFSLFFPEILPLPAAIVLGAVASATAPAATLMVVKQYKAKGPVTDTLLPVVAIDDAVGLVLFAISFGIAEAFMPGGTVNVISILVEPLLEVTISLIIGAALGLALSFLEKFFHSRSKRLSLSVAMVLLAVALTSIQNLHIGEVHIKFSPLLTCMMVGTMFCNTCEFSENIMDRLDRWTGPLFALFFVISGAELQLTIFAQGLIVLVGVIYIIARSVGKISGSLGSAKVMKAPDTVVKYLGITLLPQAGVALGMASLARGMGMLNGVDVGAIIANITIFAVLIYELVGPFLTKVALQKAGEIDEEGRTTDRVIKQKTAEIAVCSCAVEEAKVEEAEVVEEEGSDSSAE
ncbi:MAG: cation:proton antiporter [Clostridiales bacterium]|nr:cation:proton antiporter [Clostridiales bacterium]